MNFCNFFNNLQLNSENPLNNNWSKHFKLFCLVEDVCISLLEWKETNTENYYCMHCIVFDFLQFFFKVSWRRKSRRMASLCWTRETIQTLRFPGKWSTWRSELHFFHCLKIDNVLFSFDYSKVKWAYKVLSIRWFWGLSSLWEVRKTRPLCDIEILSQSTN